MANNKCEECGCVCSKCIVNDHDVHLHVEIENLKQRLLERDTHIVTMETNFLNEANEFPNGKVVALKEELLVCQEKYKRLYEAHRRVQRVNQGLEDKLLKLVDVCETEKSALAKDVGTLSQELTDANELIRKLKDENKRYKSDVALAIQFLQCKQTNFVSQKIESLPTEVQMQVTSYMSNKRKPEEHKTTSELKSIKVPIPTFPPTAMVYSVPKISSVERKLEDVESQPVDKVPASIMAKVLEERERERSSLKHCETCSCLSKNVKTANKKNVGVQTVSLLPTVSLVNNSSGMKVKNAENKRNKMFNNENQHGHTLTEAHTEVPTNVVKVQPNNFLINDCLNSNLPCSSLGNLNSDSNSIITLPNTSPEQKSSDSSKHQNVESREMKKVVKIEKEVLNVEHNLSSRLSLNSEKSVGIETSETKDVVSKVISKKVSNVSDDAKGPRYCSMRLQTGSKNILLDNAYNSISPILYTRQSNYKIKRENAIRAHETNSCVNSTSSGEHRTPVMNIDASVNNQQRIADWVRNSNDYEINSSESCASSLKNTENSENIDFTKYAEIEDNVKKFLFDRKFLKTVEIGKLKYQNLNSQEKASVAVPANETVRVDVTKSRIETEI